MVLTEIPDYSDKILKYNCNFSGQGRPHGGWRGVTEAFCPQPQPERGPGGPHRTPLNTCLNNRAVRI